MATYRRQVWNQVKGLTSQELMRALERDGWRKQRTRVAEARKVPTRWLIAIQTSRRTATGVVIHPHPKKTMGPGLLKDVLDCIGWTEDDLKRLGLVKL